MKGKKSRNLPNLNRETMWYMRITDLEFIRVVCENKGGAEVTIPCDYIVLAMGARSNEFDAAALEAASIPVYSIGDAAGKAADISNAIRTGYDTACQL